MCLARFLQCFGSTRYRSGGWNRNCYGSSWLQRSLELASTTSPSFSSAQRMCSAPLSSFKALWSPKYSLCPYSWACTSPTWLRLQHGSSFRAWWRIRTPKCERPCGWWAYRSSRTPSLYSFSRPSLRLLAGLSLAGFCTETKMSSPKIQRTEVFSLSRLPPSCTWHRSPFRWRSRHYLHLLRWRSTSGVFS